MVLIPQRFLYATFSVDGLEIRPHIAKYPNDRMAISFMCRDVDGTQEVYGRLTVNLPEVKLREGEFLVKAWGENESLAKAMRDSHFFEDTGRRVESGYARAEVWRFSAD